MRSSSERQNDMGTASKTVEITEFLNNGQSKKKKKKRVIPCIIRHCQNPSESISKKGYYKEEERLAG
jgi:hypothetical protein